MSELHEMTLGCGCRIDTDSGYMLAECKAHDRRTRAVKVAAALQDLGNWLDEAGNQSPRVPTPTEMLRAEALQRAGKAAVKAAKAMRGDEE